MDKQSLFSIEQGGEYFHFKASSGYTIDDILNAARSENPWQNLNSIGEEISLSEYAEIEQSDKFTFSVELNYDAKTVRVYTVNGGLGGIADEDRTNENCDIYDIPLNSQTSDINSSVGGDMKEIVTVTTPKIISGLITPIGNVISTNPICQLSLSVGLICVGIKLFARLVRSFGKLR